MSKLLRLVFSFLMIIYWPTVFFLHRLVAPFVALFFKDKEWGRARASYPFLKVGFWLLSGGLTVKGLENLPKDEPFILASNHQSLFDVVAYIYTSKQKVGFFAKSELLKVPILGWGLRNMGHAIVNRDNPRKALGQLEVVKKKIEAGNSFLIFPEGTRTVDGSIGAFKRGVFTIAVQTGVPVIPCFIDGAYKVMSKKSLLMSRNPISVTYGEPVRGFKAESKAEEKSKSIELMERVRGDMVGLQSQSS